ncbi:single-stranded DNA-binding protein [Pseudodesulfovibrio tunisiensis]|uniref:single-stranded DNA-binding protein n=1 Tax=Pseudodesulfovibrio tunisiensis TaxID=463192 RepID=UPI001FB1B4E2|nr:single-stranded DNA-binding protein [Pseudodesulfovibrio tunisiensis]
MSLNLQLLVGYTGNGVELRTTRSGRTMAVFSLATNDGHVDKATGEWRESVTWHRVIVFRERLARSLAERLAKGTCVLVRGKLSISEYTDSQGVERIGVDTVAEAVTVLRHRDAPAEPAPEAAKPFRHDATITQETRERLMGADHAE